MRLLKVSLEGVKLFKDNTFTLDLYAADRVVGNDSVSLLEKPLYSNNLVGLAGINASGKTSALFLLKFVIEVLMGKSAAMRTSLTEHDFLEDTMRLQTIFWHETQLYYLESIMAIDLGGMCISWDAANIYGSPSFTKEVLRKASGKIASKQILADFDAFIEHSDILLQRDKLDPAIKGFLSDDVSIVTSITRSAKQSVIFASEEVRTLSAPTLSTILDQTLHVFDSSVEYLKAYDEGRYSLKFKNSNDTHLLNDQGVAELLSSGTVRGCNIIQQAMTVLATGGYLLLDEIENHLNKQLVAVILDLFDSAETNPRGAVLIFSTHYPEILDYVKRKDNVYFLVRNDDHRTEIVKYSSRIKRIENKKSEVFLSNYIKGTAPKYSEVALLKKTVEALVGESRHER